MVQQQDCSFNSINSEVARNVLGIVLDKTQDEIRETIPNECIELAKPPCRLERVMPETDD